MGKWWKKITLTHITRGNITTSSQTYSLHIWFYCIYLSMHPPKCIDSGDKYRKELYSYSKHVLYNRLHTMPSEKWKCNSNKNNRTIIYLSIPTISYKGKKHTFRRLKASEVTQNPGILINLKEINILAYPILSETRLQEREVETESRRRSPKPPSKNDWKFG